jgi:selenide,water dikinase
VTGFGLAGHALELARGAGLALTIDWSRVPVLDGVPALAEAGFVTGASGRNWAGYGVRRSRIAAAGRPSALDLLEPIRRPRRTPARQLRSAARGGAGSCSRAEGFAAAARIGRVDAGPAGLSVVA